jgi:hypothetical protein
MKGLKFAVVVITWLTVLSLTGACASKTLQPSETPVPSSSIPIPLTPTQGPPDQILFYGNSLTYFNMGVDEHLKKLAAAADPPLTIDVKKIIMAGVPLVRVLDSHGTTEIQEGTWDIVVLQGSILVESFSKEVFFETVRTFDKAIKNAGARTLLFMTWEGKNPDLSRTMNEINQAHDEIASELGIKVAPVGLAWQRSFQERPELELYDDGIHPNLYGTYLSACVIYATIFERSPVGIDYQPFDLFAGNKIMEKEYEDWQFTDDEVAFMQQIAWETVVDYQAQRE